MSKKFKLSTEIDCGSNTETYNLVSFINKY